jgi:hypothetical protein
MKVLLIHQQNLKEELHCYVKTMNNLTLNKLKFPTCWLLPFYPKFSHETIAKNTSKWEIYVETVRDKS